MWENTAANECEKWMIVIMMAVSCEMSSEQHDIIVCNSWDWNIDNPFNPQYITDILEHMYNVLNTCTVQR